MSGDRRLGTELAGYRIDALLGQGAGGVVYRATDNRLQRTVALKLLNTGSALDPAYRRRFEREARSVTGLAHPHIVPVYDAGHERDVLYLAMRYVDGPDLATLVEDGPIELERVCELLTGVADALDTAHRTGLVHRDVKPANVLVTADGRHAYLCDFGIARDIATSTALTATGQFLGTLQYCAPEQIRGRPLDGRADQYALACVIHHCLTGRAPFDGADPAAIMFAHVSAEPPRPSTHNPDLPTTIDGVLARAMAKEPAERFPDCTAFLHALTTAAEGDPGGEPRDVATHTVIWSRAGGRAAADDTGADGGARIAEDVGPRATPGAAWRNVVHAVVSVLFLVVGLSSFRAAGECTGGTDATNAGCVVTTVGFGICCVLTLAVPVLYWVVARRGVSLSYLKLCRLPYLVPVLWVLVAIFTGGFAGSA